MQRDSLLGVMGAAIASLVSATNLRAHRERMSSRKSYGLELRVVKRSDKPLAKGTRNADSYAITMTHVPRGVSYRAAGPESREAKRRRARMGGA
jgi:hypothetical protein